MEAEERGSVARELHDVVAHSLSVIAMRVLATSLSTDSVRLAGTVDQVRGSVEAAGQELIENGHHPVLDVDPGADALDPTTQRTLSRILTEAATNILRYAPAGSGWHITLGLDGADATLRVVSPLWGSPAAESGRRSDLSLGWGLRGTRERVELTRGTFSAGPEHGQWVLAVSLPVARRTDSSEGPYVPEWDESVALPAV